jgi:hypothetical protein
MLIDGPAVSNMCLEAGHSHVQGHVRGLSSALFDYYRQDKKDAEG